MKTEGRRTPNRCLREEREKRGWSQKYVAGRIGAERYYVSRWELGIVSPSPHYRQQLCKLFEKDAKELGLLFDESQDRQQVASPEGSLPSTSTLTGWHIPYRRNLFFTGRSKALDQLHDRLHTHRTDGLQLPLALTGLGGIGKTQLAIEYAYRYRAYYQMVLWVRAELYESLLDDCRALIDLLHLSDNGVQNPHFILSSLRRWLAHTHAWLLILDNVEDPDILTEIIPAENKGHILLTTRAQTLGTLAEHMALQTMSREESTLFLLRRARIITLEQPLSDTSEILQIKAGEIVAMLDGLPLALDRAGAYIEETACGLDNYLKRYHARCTELLSMRSFYTTSDYHESIMTTLSLSIEKVGNASAAALDLLYLCAFLANESIPEDIVSTESVDLGPHLTSLASDSLALDAAIRELRRFSLIDRDSETNSLNIHRLVQTVVRERLDEARQRLWSERAVRAVNQFILEGDIWADATRARWQRCLPHAFVCASLIQQWHMISAEAMRLLYQTGLYLVEYGRYKESESIYRQALTVYQDALGQEHPQTGEVLNDLAVLSYYQGRYPEAELLYQQALTICERSLGEDDLTVAHIRHNLALCCREQGNYTLAKQLLQKTLNIREHILGATDLCVAESLQAFSSIFLHQQNFIQAEALLQRAFAIRLQKLGAEHPLIAQSLIHLGKLYTVQDKGEQAENFLLQALSIQEKAQEQNHPRIANSLHALGEVYLAQRKYAQAKEYLQRALSIRERTLPLEHTQRHETLHSLAKLAHAQENETPE